MRCNTPRPLYTNSDRKSGHLSRGMSALPPKADSCSATAYACFWANSGHQDCLFDHLVGAQQDGGWQLEADGLGRFEVEDEFKFGRQLNRQVARLLTAQDLVDISGAAPKHVDDIGPVRHQAAGVNRTTSSKDGGQAVPSCEPENEIAVARVDRTRQRDEAARRDHPVAACLVRALTAQCLLAGWAALVSPPLVCERVCLSDRVKLAVLHLRSGAREWFLAWLSREHPELVPAYSRLYGRGAYAPRSYQHDVAAQVREAAVRYGIGTRPPMRTRQPDSPVLPESAAEPQPEQLRLL